MEVASGEVYRLACLELRGGNQSAVYSAELPGLSAWVSCRPLLPATRGGDLYYLSVCSHGAISRVVLADVAGHGETVSAAAEGLRHSLHKFADHWDQSALIRQLNDNFLRRSPGAKFATAFLLSHYAGTGEMLFTNAGHLPPLWYRAAVGQWTFIEEATPFSKRIADLPLGMIPGTAYTQTGVQLETGDLVLLYTDGINETCNPRGDQMDLPGLLEIARTLPTHSAEAAGQALTEAVSRFRGDAPCHDDETVIALRRNPYVALTS